MRRVTYASLLTCIAQVALFFESSAKFWLAHKSEICRQHVSRQRRSRAFKQRASAIQTISNYFKPFLTSLFFEAAAKHKSEICRQYVSRQRRSRAYKQRASAYNFKLRASAILTISNHL